MEREQLHNYLEPPPRLISPAEALPHLGGLTLAPYRGEAPDEIELHAVERMEGAFEDATAQEMLKRAVELSQVRDRLGRGRWTPIGTSRRGETSKGERRTYVVVAYDYGSEVAIEITLDERGEFVSMTEERYQPPPTESEIERAIAIARADHRLTEKLDGLVAMAIPFEGFNNEFSNRRVLEVLFGCRSERLPKYRAWVDLSKESVLYAGGTCECCGDRNEEVRS